MEKSWEANLIYISNHVFRLILQKPLPHRYWHHTVIEQNAQNLRKRLRFQAKDENGRHKMDQNMYWIGLGYMENFWGPLYTYKGFSQQPF